MLRITVEEDADFNTYRLEGKLTGDWVKEFERCWICAKHIEPGTQFKIDLSGVSSVDERGKALLGSMVSEGAELVADNPMVTSLAHSIVENATCGDWCKDPEEDDLPSNLLLGE
jgi:ABC-type transporter Mla MlaB component